jgi:hypothetical protein
MLSLQVVVAVLDSRSPVYLPRVAHQSPFLREMLNDLTVHESKFWHLPPAAHMSKLFLAMFD